MEEIVKDKRLQANELAWSNVNQEERKSIAARLTKHSSFEIINPKDLTRTVKSSGLVTNEQLVGAYGFQALSGDMTEAYTKTRGSPLTWKNSNDVFLRGEFSSYTGGYSDKQFKACSKADVLQCPVLTSGAQKWSIHVEAFHQGFDSVALGVVSAAHDHNFSSYLSSQASEWGYRNDGIAYHNSKMPSSQGLLKFDEG
jgi:hypothetical protein